MKKAAVIHDLSGFGKCSLTAAIPVLSALGVQCCPVATAVLTGQTGYPCYHCTDLTAMLPDYIDAWGKITHILMPSTADFLPGRNRFRRCLISSAIFGKNIRFFWLTLLWGMTEMLIRFLLRGC